MAGSRRSPVLRDQWTTASDAKHHSNRDRHRPRGPRRDRGRGKPSDRGRPLTRDSGFERPSRSPPPSRSFPTAPDAPRNRRDSSPRPSNARDSPGPHPGPNDGHGIHPQRLSLVNYQDLERHNPLPGPAPFDRRRDDSPSGPPPKRKRTRSPSPRSRRPNRPPKRGGPDRGFSHKKRGGRFLGRGRGGRGSPRRGRDRRESGFDTHRRRSRSPRGGKYSPGRSSRSPFPEDFPERGHRYRSTSVHSFSEASRFSPPSRRDSRGDQSMNPTRAFHSTDDSGRSPSPRPIDADAFGASRDGEAMRESFPGVRRSEAHGSHRPRPHRLHGDARQYSGSPRYATPTNDHGSPPPTSPYSSGRGRGSGYHKQHG